MVVLREMAQSRVSVGVQRSAWVCVACVVCCAMATALAAQVRIQLPFSPVPLTMQTFVVLLSGALLGSRAGAASQVLYVALGTMGMPIFTSSGAFPLGVTAGYLLAFPVAAWVVGRAREHQSAAILAAGFVAATLAIHALGTAWLALLTGSSVAHAAMLGSVPFLFGDALKAVAAWIVARPARRLYEAAAGIREKG